MRYELINSTENDIEKLIQYKLNSILDYAENLDNEEINKIKYYVNNSINNEYFKYQNIVVNNEVAGCLYVIKKDDGVLLNELYLNKELGLI